MPAVIRFNQPKRDDITSPTAAERWVLTRVREALAATFEVSEVCDDPAWSHHEDEELGIPPLGTMAFVSISLPHGRVQLQTQYWHAPAADALLLHVYAQWPGTQDAGVRFAHPTTAQRLSSLGLERWSASWGTTWQIRTEQDHAVVAAIVCLVEALAATPFAAT